MCPRISAQAAAAFRWPRFLTPRQRRLCDELEDLSEAEAGPYTLSPAEWAALRASAPYRARPQVRIGLDFIETAFNHRVVLRSIPALMVLRT